MSDDSITVRVARLEERLAWFERHVTEQDKAMMELVELVERLRRELLVLRERSSSPGGLASGDQRVEDERPPHY